MPQNKPNWSEVPPRDWGEEQAHRIAGVIKQHRRSAQWLADETRKMGFEVTRTVIADLENGRRRYVTTAELLIFAQALRMTPVALLYPGPYDLSIQLLPQVRTSEIWAAQWFSGLMDGQTVESLATGEPRSLAEDEALRAEYKAAYDENLRHLRTARQIFELEDKRLALMFELRRRKDELLEPEREEIRDRMDEYRAKIDSFRELLADWVKFDGG